MNTPAPQQGMDANRGAMPTRAPKTYRLLALVVAKRVASLQGIADMIMAAVAFFSSPTVAGALGVSGMYFPKPTSRRRTAPSLALAAGIGDHA